MLVHQLHKGAVQLGLQLVLPFLLQGGDPNLVQIKTVWIFGKVIVDDDESVSALRPGFGSKLARYLDPLLVSVSLDEFQKFSVIFLCPPFKVGFQKGIVAYL